MLKEEKRFVREIELNRAVDLIYGSILEQLHENKVAWDEMENKVWKEIDPSLMSHDKDLAKRMAYKGQYRISLDKHNTQKNYFFSNIVMKFTPLDPKAEIREYTYSAVIQREIPQGREMPKTENQNVESKPAPQVPS